MDKKLTLSLNATVVEKAKGYAKDHGISLSRMIENYLSSLISKQPDDKEMGTISPLVERLIGVIEVGDNDFGYKSDYVDYLTEKYK